MQTEILEAGSPGGLERAVLILEQGGVVAFPTDTVYGLGGLVTDGQAIEQLFVVKGRESAKAIAVLVGRLEDVGRIAELRAGGMPAAAERLAERFWPGALTLVVGQRPGLPGNLSPLPTVGVRMPDHPAALALLRRMGPLAVTSANLSGAASTQTAQEVFEQLEGRIPLILDGGRTPGGAPSTVVDCTSAAVRVLRAGPITEEQIMAVVQMG